MDKIKQIFEKNNILFNEDGSNSMVAKILNFGEEHGNSIVKVKMLFGEGDLYMTTFNHNKERKIVDSDDKVISLLQKKGMLPERLEM